MKCPVCKRVLKISSTVKFDTVNLRYVFCPDKDCGFNSRPPATRKTYELLGEDVRKGAEKEIKKLVGAIVKTAEGMLGND